MEPNVYGLMYELEESHWWYRGLRDLVLSYLKKYLGDGKVARVLDAGCGTGFNLKCFGNLGDACGIDISDAALECCAKRGLTKISKSSVTDLPFKDGSFDAVVSTDVLYHKAVSDDDKAINEMARVLKDRGFLIANLPAFEHLRRPHDEKVHTSRRYTARMVSEKMERNGLEVIKLSYRNGFLYPAAFLLSVCGKNAGEEASDLGRMPAILNSLLYGLTVADNFIVKNFGVPFGTSVFCVARKSGRR